MTSATATRVRCRSCGRRWPATRTTCPKCLAELPRAGEADLVCRYCGKKWPPTMEMCPVCLAELRPNPTGAIEEAIQSGRPAYRSAGVAAFAAGDAVTLRRLTADGAFAYLSADVVIEANVKADGDGYLCADIEGPVLFRMRRQGAAWLATTSDGMPLASFELRPEVAVRVDVRDEASAPCARLVPRSEIDYDLVETGGGRLATCDRDDRELEGGWVDDAWSLAVIADRMPLKKLGLIALPLAAKLLLGRATPERSTTQA